MKNERYCIKAHKVGINRGRYSYQRSFYHPLLHLVLNDSSALQARVYVDTEIKRRYLHTSPAAYLNVS